MHGIKKSQDDEGKSEKFDIESSSVLTKIIGEYHPFHKTSCEKFKKELTF